MKPVIWALLALFISAPVLAAVSFTNNEYYIQDGSPFTITWTGNRGPVSVTLMNGPDENQQEVLVIVSGYEAQEYTWTPPPTLPADAYRLRLEDAGSTDYSPRFRYPAPLQVTTSGNSGPTPTSSTDTEPPSSSATTPPATETADSPKTTTPPLSTTAIAIIATLGGLLLLTLALFACYIIRRRRRRQRHETHAAMALEMMGGYDNGNEHGSEVYTYGQSPSTVVAGNSSVGVGIGGSGGGGGVVNMKVGDGQGMGYGYGRAELPVRGRDEMVELSAEGRYLR